MRLIDADNMKTIHEIQMANFNSIEGVREWIDRHPTAFDIDNVVEELEERKALHERLVDYETKNGTVTEKYQHIKAIDVLNDAIEIVKHGGVADDVCEWKYVSDGEFIRNPHTNRLYSNEPSMKNVYCNTCGKKIKIVGE